jgi:hypothetical protein
MQQAHAPQNCYSICGLHLTPTPFPTMEQQRAQPQAKLWVLLLLKSSPQPTCRDCFFSVPLKFLLHLPLTLGLHVPSVLAFLAGDHTLTLHQRSCTLHEDAVSSLTSASTNRLQMPWRQRKRATLLWGGAGPILQWDSQ